MMVKQRFPIIGGTRKAIYKFDNGGNTRGLDILLIGTRTLIWNLKIFINFENQISISVEKKSRKQQA